MRRILRIFACIPLIVAVAWWAGQQGVAAEPAAVAPKSRDGIRDGNRLAYLDENNPWYPHRNFPRLITPQWVGEEGVECVVVLAIDDMREPAKYEAFLRPILNRLKQIDGRAPVSIMTCNVKPDDPQLAQWLAEGLSLEVHTLDHPCPLLQGGDFAKAKSTYDRCVDLMNEIPGNKPVAFRMPCCDSLNTLSPRFYSEIFNSGTSKGNYLSISSSVFNLFTPNDPEIPRELVLDPDGRDKFRKYLPKGLVREGKTFNTFTNYIEDYPYPYVINRLCWEFPCVIPSDWSAQHLQKPNNPDTVRDLKAALDITVLKQGVYNLVFHPHNWIKPEQVVEIIDHAVAKHGKKVKFLTFREALERLNQNLFSGRKNIRTGDKVLAQTLLDIDNDGHMDVILGGQADLVGPPQSKPGCRIWRPGSKSWEDLPFPCSLNGGHAHGVRYLAARFGVLKYDGEAAVFTDQITHPMGIWTFADDGWYQIEEGYRGIELPEHFLFPRHCSGFRFRDLDRDGRCEILDGRLDHQAIYRFDRQKIRWDQLPFALPGETHLTVTRKRLEDPCSDSGLRFVDIDEDGYDDIVFSNAERYGIYLFNDMQTGWSRVVVEGTRSVAQASGGGHPAGASAAQFILPPIVRADGTDNGFFVHARHLFWQNEETDKLPDLVDRRSFNEILAQAPDLPPKPKSPDAALRSIQVRPGFKVELMAAEPLVLDPVALEFGPDGKLWVVEMGDYPLGPGGGQIRCLEDTDGDGKFDKATVFLDVPFPTGVLPWGRGVLVTAAPNVLYAEDTDGDGKADKQEILYSGFSEGNPQHRVNGLVRGLDNWLYIANGDSGGTIVSHKTGKKVSINGRDLRIRPEIGDLDAVTGQTQFGRSRDDWGNWFGCNNSNPMYQFVLDDGYQRRNPHFPGTSPRVDVPIVAGNAPVFPISPLLERFNDYHTANRFTSACSAMIYRDDLFGPHFAGNAFICEPVHNLIHRDVVSAAGLLFTSRRAPDEVQSEFLASSDNWFRPTTVKAGPDGALWIADMYRHVIEHPQWIPDTWQKKLDLRAGHDKGRIYRVVPVDKKPRSIPRFDILDTAGLVAALDSPSGWQRDTVQQLLVARKDKVALPLLERQVSSHANPLCRLHALATLGGYEDLSETILIKALDDEHPGVRRHAVALAESMAGNLSDALQNAVLKRTNDSDPHVRLQLAYTLGALKGAAPAATIGEMLVSDGGDRFLLSALMSSVNKANVENVLTKVLASSRESQLNQNLIINLLDLAAALGNDQALVRLLQSVTAGHDGMIEVWQYSALARLLDSLARRNESLTDKIKKSKAADADKLLASVDRFFAAARKAADDGDAKIDDRRAAVQLLGRGRNERDSDLQLLDGLLAPQIPAELQQEAVAALGRLRHEQIPEIIVNHWRGFVPGRRMQALDVLMSRDAWAAALLTAVADERIALTDFDAAHRQRLLEHRSLDVRQKAAAAFASGASTDRQKVVDEYQSALTLAGDAAHGAQLFGKMCAQCHKLAGVGHEVGPDLTSLTDKSSDALLVAVLDPNRAVETKFLTFVVETRAGMTLSGLLASETGNSLTLLGPERKEQVVLRSEIEELVGTSKSMMPEGLEKDLQPQDLADLIAHVRSHVPLPQRKEFAGNAPRTVVSAADGTLLLEAATCEIYGSLLVFEAQYKNLGFWSSLDDHAVWNIEVGKPGKYAVEFDWACDGSVAGNPWQLKAAGETLSGQVESTGGWDTYRRARVGEISLKAGKQQVVLRPAVKPQGAMIDLKSIRLTPVK